MKQLLILIISLFLSLIILNVKTKNYKKWIFPIIITLTSFLWLLFEGEDL